jgi:lactoylglutathione lyase
MNTPETRTIEPQPHQATPRYAGTAIYVNDVRASLDFYRRAFGMKTRFFDAALDYGELDTGATILAFGSHRLGELLMPGKYLRSENGQAAGVEVAFFTADVPGTFARALAAGALALAEPKLMPWGATVAYLRAPDGTFIGLSTPLPPAAKEASDKT